MQVGTFQKRDRQVCWQYPKFSAKSKDIQGLWKYIFLKLLSLLMCYGLILYVQNWLHLDDNIYVQAEKNGEKRLGGKSCQCVGTVSGMDVRYKDIFLPGLFQPDSRGLFGIEESNNLHLFPLVPWLMKNAFTTCFALTGFSGGFWSLATCHWDCSWWKYDVQVMAFSASSICCSVIEAGLVKGIWAINKAQGGLGASTYCTAVVKDINV